MAYTVQNVELIPQSLAHSCWYASAQMLIAWKQNSHRQLKPYFYIAPTFAEMRGGGELEMHRMPTVRFHIQNALTALPCVR